jgi:hypothetical protein
MTHSATNQKIRNYCDAHGLEFKPWEVHPADADTGPSPWPAGSGGAESWPKAQKLRRKILADIRAAKRGAKT